jgi:hypothetical protein
MNSRRRGNRLYFLYGMEQNEQIDTCKYVPLSFLPSVQVGGKLGSVFMMSTIYEEGRIEGRKPDLVNSTYLQVYYLFIPFHSNHHSHVA